MEEEQEEKPVQQELKAPGASMGMLLPALLHSAQSFVSSGKPRAPAVRSFYRQMLELYESASPEARAMLDKIGGDTMEGFNAWATQGLGERGGHAVEWAKMVRNLPMVGMGGAALSTGTGGRREVSELQEGARGRVFDKQIRSEAEEAGVPYEDYKNMGVMDRRRALMPAKQREGLRKTGLPQLTDFMIDSFGMIPGMAPVARIAHRAVSALPGMTGYHGQTVGDTFKDFVKEDLPGLALDAVTQYVAPRIPGINRIPGLGRGVPVLKNEKSYAQMSVQERAELPFRRLVRRQDSATKVMEDTFKAENTAPPRTGILGFELPRQTSANPKNNKDMPTDEELMAMRADQAEQAQTNYETSQRGNQARERPDLKMGTNEQKQDLAKRQMRAQQDAELSGALKERKKALSDAANIEAYYAKQRAKGRGCSSCGSAAPSAKFMREVLKHYR